MRDGRRIVRRCACLLGLGALSLACLPASALGAESQTINFIKSKPPEPARAHGTYTVEAEATPSKLEVTFAAVPAAETVCKAGPTTIKEGVSEATVTLLSAGKCQIEAEQGGNKTWERATQLGEEFTVIRDTQTVAFASNPPEPARVGATYTVRATASSKLQVAFAAQDNAVCDVGASTVNAGVSEATVSLLGVGTCAIEASQAGDETQWEPAAASKPQEFAVSKTPQEVKFTSAPPTAATVGGSYVVAAEATSTLAVVLSSATPSVCTLSGAASGSTVTFVGAGTCTILANQGGDAVYEPAPQEAQSFAISPVIVISSPPAATLPPPPSGSSPTATTSAKSSFKAISATLHSPSFTITLKEQVSDPGTLSWALTFLNGTFGVFGSTAKSTGKGKCKAGFMRLSGKCRPKRVTYGRGSMSFAAAGTVTITVKPSAAAKQALKTALRKKKNMRITAVLTFKPRNGATAVTHTQLLTVKLSSAK
jgi:hypothetical protein